MPVTKQRTPFLFVLSNIIGIYGIFMSAAFADEDSYYKNSPGCVIDRGNPERTGVYNAQISDHPKILWQTAAMSLHAPICADNLIVMNPLVAFDFATGKKVWDVRNIGGKYHYPATYYKGVIYWDKQDGTLFSQEDKSQNLMKFNPKTGKLLYQKGFGIGNSNGMLIYNDIAYLCLDDGVTAYDLKKNKILWKNGGFVNGGLSTDGHVLFVSNGGLYVLDMRSGQILWESSNLYISSQVTVGKDNIYADVRSDDDKGGIIAYEKKTGKIVWQHYYNDVPGFSKHGGLSNITLHNDQLFVSNLVQESIAMTEPTQYSPKGGGVYALDAKTGKLLWHREIAPFTEPISINNTLYVGGQNVVYALDEKTGKERWHLKVDGDAMHLVPYQNKLFVKIGMYISGKLLAIG